MGGATNQFFAEKRPWSRIKDQILTNDLTPYLAKVAKTRRAVVVADCFAGKGVFDDGELGSPVIICKAIDYQLQRWPGTEMKAVFIENKYSDDLTRNLERWDYAKVLSGDYRTRVENIKYTWRKEAMDGNRVCYRMD